MNTSTLNQGFDYIIVGAGSAGCVLANRLSADPTCRVLLLEAGGPSQGFWLRLPVGYFRTINDTRFSWQFPVEPQAETGQRAMVWPRGKVLGGSSAINGLLYIRGQRADYDDWAALGATGWSYQEVLPYFKRSERYDGGANEFHGAAGELGVSDLRNDHPYCEAWLEAAAQAGHPRTPDFNGAQADGSWTAQPGLACTVMVADCLPVLLCSADGARVAALHAGWRGLAGGGYLMPRLLGKQRATEMVLLGVLAMRVKDRKLQWDGAAFRFINDDEANALVNPAYNNGWTL